MGFGIAVIAKQQSRTCGQSQQGKSQRFVVAAQKFQSNGEEKRCAAKQQDSWNINVGVLFGVVWHVAPACQKAQQAHGQVNQEYPMPLYTSNKNDCEIGRIRKDLYNDKGMNFWIVGDQIRKGAALNALQIAEYIVEKQAF